jgi:ABC-type dipeptide/oligopeptide/nickel transport system permease component
METGLDYHWNKYHPTPYFQWMGEVLTGDWGVPIMDLSVYDK